MRKPGLTIKLAHFTMWLAAAMIFWTVFFAYVLPDPKPDHELGFASGPGLKGGKDGWKRAPRFEKTVCYDCHRP